jgi:hypothetical protein
MNSSSVRFTQLKSTMTSLTWRLHYAYVSQMAYMFKCTTLTCPTNERRSRVGQNCPRRQVYALLSGRALPKPEQTRDAS